jgi:sortase (surface protein transpeptidase)
VVVALGVGGLALVAATVGHALSTAQESEVLAPEAGPRPEAAARAASARMQMAIPVRISIPAIGVKARVVKLGLNADRTIQVPTSLADTGWFQPGPEPGETGAAVILGHLASRSGPGVFINLSKLRRGQLITIRLADGSTVRFVAQSKLRVSKNRFPTRLVYARTARPTLRLITCAGPLNRATGHHPDNYIVFATLARR